MIKLIALGILALALGHGLVAMVDGIAAPIGANIAAE